MEYKVHVPDYVFTTQFWVATYVVFSYLIMGLYIRLRKKEILEGNNLPFIVYIFIFSPVATIAALALLTIVGGFSIVFWIFTGIWLPSKM